MTASDKILHRLTALHPKKIDLSLGRMERLLARLDHPERKLPPVFHVAGTNGKGSTVAYLRAILEAAGHRVHAYISPHLVAFRERIRIGGRLIAEDELAALLQACEDANGSDPITFFEVTTAAAFLAFARHPADAVLLEVGLGGRLDATNVVADPLVTAVAPVSLDHQEFLGDSLAAVAAEKAGIAKSGRPLVVGAQDPAALSAILDHAAAAAAVPLVLGRDWRVELGGGGFRYRDQAGQLDLPAPSLRGRHQPLNAALAVACLRHQQVLSIPDQAYAEGITQAVWPARLQDISHAPGLKPGRCEILLDGGHNPAGAATVAVTLREDPKPTVLIFGLLANKDAAGFLSPFRGLTDHVYAVPIAGESCHKPEDLVAVAAALGLSVSPVSSWEAALDQALAMDGIGRIVICGSLYLAGQVLDAVGLPPA